MGYITAAELEALAAAAARRAATAQYLLQRARRTTSDVKVIAHGDLPDVLMHRAEGVRRRARLLLRELERSSAFARGRASTPTFVQDNHSPLRAEACCAACTTRSGSRRASSCAWSPARSSTSRSTCAAPRPPSASGSACALSAENKRQLWIPPGFAHGFLVLSRVAPSSSTRRTDYYAPEHERAIAWNDPDLAIEWPLAGDADALGQGRGRRAVRATPKSSREDPAHRRERAGRLGARPRARTARRGHRPRSQPTRPRATRTPLRETVRAIAPDRDRQRRRVHRGRRAESEPELASAINAIAPGVLAEEAQRLDAILVHYSTDYVFDGAKAEPYVESDPTNPLSVYGRTKLEGERAIGASGCRHLILRTSWVYGARGHNFLLTMLRLARERRQLRIVDDQIGAPTWCARYRAGDGDVAGAAGTRDARRRGPVSLDGERGDVVVRLCAGDLRLAGDGAARRRTAGDRGHPDERLSDAGKAAAELAAGLQSARAPCRDTARAVGCGTPQCSRRSRLAVDQHYRGRQAYACGAGEELAIERPQRIAAPGACVV